MTSRPKKKVAKSKLIRAAASSSAIETGVPTKIIEAKLNSQNGKFKHLSLAFA
ncbi:hypothetical protein J9B83_14520 [Marinomonas sp. A79]|uniref:Uncharacterized protein n=1 Tax=Marinomonas vulgaris TaxID=2823372 RepID=A0ABS5HEN9_9GAMM|nr:hypothetical protein [Marinomonas vulgaris]MBR7890125.1 hypothetical protein [Marinomonas vulgaris]